jgi:hypothetical protein
MYVALCILCEVLSKVACFYIPVLSDRMFVSATCTCRPRVWASCVLLIECDTLWSGVQDAACGF